MPMSHVHAPCSGVDYAIILAAGFSTRMGTCKAALPWSNGETLLSYQVAQLLEAGITPIVVAGTHNQPQTSFHGGSLVINLQPQQGKTSSILTGLAIVPATAETILISAVDQPRPTAVYAQLLHAHRRNSALITAPIYQERMGHPLIFSTQLLPELLHLSESTFGLRQVIKSHAQDIQRVGFDTPIVLADLNTPEQYRSQLATEITST